MRKRISFQTSHAINLYQHVVLNFLIGLYYKFNVVLSIVRFRLVCYANKKEFTYLMLREYIFCKLLPLCFLICFIIRFLYWKKIRTIHTHSMNMPKTIKIVLLYLIFYMPFTTKNDQIKTNQLISSAHFNWGSSTVLTWKFLVIRQTTCCCCLIN